MSMKKYYVNKNAQPGGEHEVHDEDCRYLPSSDDRKELGSFSGCKDAVKEAKKHYTEVDGCKTCSKECHTR